MLAHRAIAKKTHGLSTKFAARHSKRALQTTSFQKSGSSHNTQFGLKIGLGAILGVTAFTLYQNYVHADEDDTTVVPKGGKLIPNTGITQEQKLLIYRGVATNRLVRLLDQEQQDAMLEHMIPVEFEAGSHFIKEGEQGDFFYVMESGECEVFNHTGDVVRSCFAGDSFGEGGFTLFTKRSASVKAKTKIRCWCIDRNTFAKAVLPRSQRLRKIYNKYASISSSDGELKMTHLDFLNSMNMLDVEDDSQSKYKYLFEIAGRDSSGTLNFAEFALFDIIASKPDAEFEIAFRVFDTQNNGLVSKDDVMRVLSEGDASSKFRFNPNCNLMVRFFGPDGKRKLRPLEFSQFFLNLTEEIPRQLYGFYDKDSKGYINGEQFGELLQGFGSYRLPKGVQERLFRLKSLTEDNGVVTYGEFIAFNEFLNHLPALDNLVLQACNKKGGPITKDEFKIAAMNTLASNVSPLEIDVIFNLFDTNRDGKVDHKDFRCVTHFGRRCTAEELKEISKTKRSFKEAEATGESGVKSLLHHVKESATHFGLGAIAGGTGATAVYPIDLVKTRMQNQRALDASQRLYKNSLDCFRKVYTQEGFGGLYRGLIPQLMGVAPEKAIKLTVNDLLRSLFRDERKGTIYFPLEVLAGCGAGASQVIFTNPIEIVKIRLQIQGESAKLDPTFKPKSAFKIASELGLLGLYRGASACLLRDIPFSGIYFPVYAASKSYLAEQREDGLARPIDLLLAGALAGVPAASLVTPADVIKTRLQVEARKGEQTYSGIADCAVKVYKTEGMRAFWKGAGARVFRSSPQFGVTLLAYEMLQRFLTPELTPRPPTNAPVTVEDFDAFRRSFVADQIKSMEEKLRKVRRD